MSLTSTAGTERTPALEAGVYTAVCTMVVDLGIQYNQTFNKSTEQVKILWNVVGETVEINGETLPRQIGKDFTNSLNEKSTLRKMLTSWRGRPFTADELKEFDLTKLLGASCQLQLIHKENERGTFAVVDSIMQLPKGMEKPKAEKTVIFNMDDPATYGAYDTLPRYIQEKVSQAENFVSTGLVLPPKNGNGNGNGGTSYSSYGAPPPANFEEISSDDDLPF